VSKNYFTVVVSAAVEIATAVVSTATTVVSTAGVATTVESAQFPSHLGASLEQEAKVNTKNATIAMFFIIVLFFYFLIC
jgi:hypothetical protein